jgi:tellurite resistance protein
MEATIKTQSWLAHVPVPLFASVMGLSGLGLAWRRAAQDLGWPSAIGEGVLLLGALAFTALAVLYLGKLIRHPGMVVAEFIHPVRSSFFAAATIGLMLLSVGLAPHAPKTGEIVWMIASAAHLAVALAVFRQWFAHNIDIRHSNPAWFIPVVGNIVAPLGAVAYGYPEVGWFFFSVGVTFWLVLFPIILNRIIFHDQLPARFMPTLVILLAPPSVSFLSYLGLNDGQIDGFARMLFFVALFTAMLIVVLSSLFVRTPFALSWWAYTFPSAAFALATIRYHAAVGGPVSSVLAHGLLLIATAIVFLVLARTLLALVAGRLFVPES